MEVIIKNYIAEHPVRNGLLDFSHGLEQQALRFLRS